MPAVLAMALAGVLVGCGDMGSLAYFLTPEQPLEAKMKHLATADPKKEPPRVIILTSGQDNGAEFIHADRQISEALAKNLRDLAQIYKQRINIIPPRKVEEFKNTHPDWRTMCDQEIGDKFGADYVISLEIQALSMYEPNNNTLYRGQTNMLVKLVDVKHPDESPLPEDYACSYPTATGVLPVDADMPPQRFRQQFTSHIARQLAWRFSNYPRSENRIMESIN
jgi:hypothetical protein